ncbi:MAG: histidine kinase [Cyclobacteriaceae bacterium]|nr:histidine kinase [Cyclobacteriaceae bacterium]
MKHLFLLFSLILLTEAFSQRYNFKEYNVSDGLIHSTITAITEDQRGYLWMGTYDGGISQFDGNTFVNYSDKEGFTGNRIYDIEVDDKNEIWIGCEKAGLANYNGNKFTFYTKKDGLKTNKVRSILFTSAGQFWIGTSGGINLMKNDSIQEFEYNNLLPEYGVTSLIETHDNKILIATLKGLYIYNQGKLDSIKNVDGEGNGYIYCLKEDSKGDVWIGTHHGIAKYDGKSITKYNMGGGASHNIIQAIDEDREGNIWFATHGGGAFVYDGKIFKNLSEKNGLSNNDIYVVYKNSNDILWIGGDGINKLFGEGFKHLTKEDGLSHNRVFPIIEDEKGDIWMGTAGGGVSRYNPDSEKIINYSKKDGLTGNNAYALLESSDGEIWVATQSGLNKYEDGKFIQHPKYKGLEIWTLTEDNDGNIWIGTSYGVVREENINKTLYEYVDRPSLANPRQSILEMIEFLNDSYSSIHYSKSNGFANDMVYASNLDDEGNLWLGTYGSGVFKYSDNKFEAYNTNNGLNSNSIRRVVTDKEGGMWFGTEKGISHYKNGKIKNYTKEDGLWMNLIFNLVVDGDNIWIGGSKGIQKLTFNEYGDIVEETKFGEHEGFTSIETNGVGGLLDSKGNLWFGTIKGVTIINPDLIYYESSLTTSHITNIKLFFKEVDWMNYTDSISDWYRLPISLTLPHDKNQLTFEFTGINLKVPEKIKYKWKLEGFDHNWSPETSKREANYTNLPPGNYDFLVMASNEKDVWNPVPTSISFQIDYPIYQRWWFIILCGLLSISAIWGFVSYRLKHVRKISTAKQLMLETERKMVESERKALRTQINPHFIFNVLNSIQYYIQDNDPLVASRYLSKFAKLMRMVLDNSKSSSVPLVDELEALKLYMDLEILRSEQKFEYNIDVKNNIDVYDCYVPPMLIQPFIENSILHGIIPSTHKGVITINLSQNNHIICCAIEDNGIGINSSLKNKQNDKTHVSMGMKITSDRIDIINSQRSNEVNIEIVDISEFDKEKTGTRVTIYIPIE